jgi:Zinc finger found in FPG and IleRS
MALYGNVMELVEKNKELVEENHTLKDQLKAIQKQRDISAELKPHDNAYWTMKGSELDGPFCMRCWDVDKTLVRERAGATQGTHYCPECAQRRR